MKKRNSQLEHGQPLEQTRGFFFKCNKGLARCQPQHQYHFWRMSLMFKAYCTGSCQSNLCNPWGYEPLQKSKDTFKDCFKTVNIRFVSIIRSFTAAYQKHVVKFISDILQSGDVVDRFWVFTHPERIRQQCQHQTVFPPICELLLIHHLYRIFQGPTSGPTWGL